MNKKVWIPLILLSAAVCTLSVFLIRALVFPTEPNFVSLMKAEELDQLLEEKPNPYQLIDLRDENDFIQGHIPGFSNLPFDDGGELLLSYLQPFEKDTPVLLICYGGNRSARAFELLVINGYQNITDFTPGYNRYEKAKGDEFEPELGDCGCPDEP